MRLHPTFPMLILSACVGSPSPPAADTAAPTFAPIAFFSGRTQGEGILKIMMSRPRAVRVEGEGRVGGDGNLMLVQRIDQQGKPARTRRWLLRPIGPGTYSGTLSDAIGPVTVAVDGNLLHVRFRAKGGLAVEQWLELQPDNRAVRNHLVVKRLGIRVAVLDEIIHKIE